MRVINCTAFLRLGNMSCLGEAFPGLGSGKISLLEVSLSGTHFPPRLAASFLLVCLCLPRTGVRHHSCCLL